MQVNPKIYIFIFFALSILLPELSGSRRVINKYDIQVTGDFLPASGKVDVKTNLLIIIYTDPLCPACYETNRDLHDLLSSSKYRNKMAVVYKELPIYGRLSLELSSLALAAHLQGKYEEFKVHIEENLKKNNNDWRVIACNSSIDVKKVECDVNDPKLISRIKKNLEEFNKLNVSATPPILVIGNTIIQGYLPPRRLRAIIDRELKKANNS